jgi:hypothetical protein
MSLRQFERVFDKTKRESEKISARGCCLQGLYALRAFQFSRGYQHILGYETVDGMSFHDSELVA